MEYQERKFLLPEMEGLSKNSIEAHLALYAGYVKNFNALMTAQEELLKYSEKNAHTLSEVVRRLPFEWDGMRLHEYYFSQWESGAKDMNTNGALAKQMETQFGSAEAWTHRIKGVASMRGPGWAILYFDPVAQQLHNVWVEQHHQGHFATLPIVLALDVWEHAFVADYGTAGRGKYIEACFKNYNWRVMEERFEKAIRS